MHIMALVWADPGVVWHIVIGKIGRKLAEIHYIGHACRVVLHILVGDEGIVLALIKLLAIERVTACVI